jgi:hypothetical protein
MSDDQIESAKLAYEAIETKTNEAVAKWAFDFIIPFIAPDSVN